MSRRWLVPAAAGAVLATAAAAALAPLWTYAVSLALFGLPHVLVELRYVDQRFSARLPPRTAVPLWTGLLAIVTLRVLAVAGVGTGPGRTVVELAIGGALVVSIAPLLRARGRPVAALTIAALGAGAIWAPITALVLLALLHNLTPVGFLAERLRGSGRRRAMAVCALVFGAVPLALLLGAGEALADAIGLAPIAGGPFGGELDEHLPAFVPPPLIGHAIAERLFAAAAYLQCLHYAVVLHVLPPLAGPDTSERSLVRWPAGAAVAVGVVLVGLPFTLGFAADFGATRSLYAPLAALHAWLEIPLLVLACGVPRAAAAPALAR